MTFTDSEGIAHCKVARLTEWGFSISQSVRLAFLSRRPKAPSSVIWKLIAAQAPNGPFLLQVFHFLLSLNKFVIYTSEMRVSAICNGYWRSSKSEVDLIITPSSNASKKDYIILANLHHKNKKIVTRRRDFIHTFLSLMIYIFVLVFWITPFLSDCKRESWTSAFHNFH